MKSTASKRSAFCLSLLFVIGLTGLAGAVQPLAAQRVVLPTSVDGTYALRLSTRKSEEAARNAVIASAVEKLGRDAAKRWQAVLEIMALPQGRVRIATANGEIAVTAGDRQALKSAESGTARPLDSARQLSQKMESGALVQRVTSTSLDKDVLPTPLQVTRKYALDRDQKTLTVETRIEGGVLTQAVVFNTTYERI